MNIRHLILALAFICSSQFAFAQEEKPTDKKCFVGSTFFMLLNLVDDPEPPHYAQINFGYRFSEKNVLSLEAITWRYYEPLGVPLPEKKSAENFPGYVKAYGLGLAFKRFLWKQSYVQLHSTLMRQSFMDKEDKLIQKGTQLFNTLRIGYQFRFFDNRIFIEPSLAMTFWPINTNLPESFQKLEDQQSSYLLGEPGLHFGINF